MTTRASFIDDRTPRAISPARRTRGRAIVASIAAAVVLAWACAALPASAGAAVSTFDVTGTDSATGSIATSSGLTGTTAAGDTLDWVLHYRNTAGERARTTLSNPIGAHQTLVAGTLDTPPGLAPRWSVDGGAGWLTGEPAQGANAVGADGTQVPGSTGDFAISTQTVTGFDAGNQAGDGYEALFIGDNVYNVHHHYISGDPENRNGTMIDCHPKTSTGASPPHCPGYPANASSAADVPLGNGPTTVTTAQHPIAAVDRDHGRIYFPAGIKDTKSVGVECIDVVHAKSCGFTKLGDAQLANNFYSDTQIDGGGVIGTRLYLLGESAQIYCFDYATGAPCPGQPLTVPSLPVAGADLARSANNSTLDVFDDRYVFVNYDEGTSGPERDLFCYDMTGATPTQIGTTCPGFPVMHYGGPYAPGEYWFRATLAPVLDPTGAHVTGICGNEPLAGGHHPFACYQVADDPLTPAGTRIATPWIEQTSGTAVNWRSGGFVETIGPKLYFAETASGGVATYTCWDFSLPAAGPGLQGDHCRGFTNATTGKQTSTYTLRQDPSSQDCIWAIGDNGVFETFSATYGGTSCALTTAHVTVDPAAYYCDGGGLSHTTGWDKLIVDGAQQSQYSGLTVSITDENGDPVPGWTERAVTPVAGGRPDEQTVDISSIALAGPTGVLHVSTTWVGLDSSVSALPSLTVMFAGDPVQACFKTRVGPACTAGFQVEDHGVAVTTPLGGGGDGPGGNPSGTATFTAALDPTSCRADLSMAKRPDPGEAIPGKRVTYDLAVTNHGPDRAENVKVSDSLPPELTFVSASSGCTENAGTVTCTEPTLAAGASHTFQVVVEVSDHPGPTVVNTASVSSDTTDPDLSNNSARSEIPAGPKSDLSITKTASAATTQAGGQVVYTLLLANQGPSDATGVSVEDQLPAGLSPTAVEPSQGTCTTAGNRVTCSLGTVVEGGRAQVLVTAQVAAAATGSLTNGASVRGDEPDPDLADNSASATVTIVPGPPPPPADLRVALHVDRASAVGPRPITYTATVTNAGPATAENVSVVDTTGLPVSVRSVTTSTGTCTTRMPVSCSLGRMPSGATAKITIVVTARRIGELVDAIRVVAATPDPHPADNLARVTTNVRGALRLKMHVAGRRPARAARAAAIPTVRAGHTAKFIITASNATTLTLRHVRVCDTLPSGLSYSRASRRPKASRGRFCWSISTLGSHRSTTYRLTVRALRGAHGVRRNRATASAPHARSARASAAIRISSAPRRPGGVTG